MRKQEAVSLLGCSDRAFSQFIREGAIRRVTLRNGHYSYNEEDVKRIADIKTSKSEYTLNLDDLDNISQILTDIRRVDSVKFVSKNENLIMVLKAIKNKY